MKDKRNNLPSGIIAFAGPLLLLTAFQAFAGVGGGVEAKESVAVVPLLRTAFIFLVAMSLLFGVVLAIAAKKFFVKVDPRVEKITEVLAHAHCGACGFAGCEQYAEAVIKDPDVAPNLCTPGGKTCAQLVAELSGKVAQEREPRYARIMCQGSDDKATRKFIYTGVKDCRAAVLAGGGDKTCPYGCLGYGTCVSVCPFGALSMGANGLPVVDDSKCTGCGMCAKACPRNVIEILPASTRIIVACHSKDKGAVTRKYCTVGCIGCGKCVKVCEVKAPKVENNLSRIDPEKCVMAKTCIPNCPTHSIIEVGTIVR
ncbi:MAG: Fe-S cluster domain-containing protein [Chitinispirillaceae bacterium]|nr:Fe-S cluster domain-containing protein [Chitinispirillaceae bacterium]